MRSEANWPVRSVELTANARTILEKRYLRREGDRILEEPEDMFLRVARVIAAVDRDIYGASESETDDLARRFYDLFADRVFMPNSPTLMNAGRELGQLAACFVLPIEDSMVGIFDTLKAAALIHQSGGGTGFSFARLRPKDDRVSSTGGLASGPISFLKVYNAATEAVKQGGTRRGANMGVLRVDHPDIEGFITAKENEGDISNFNLSVAATDPFMDMVRSGGSYELINPRTGDVQGTLDARKVFRKIADMAWANGEPGLIFLDRINAANPTPHIGAVESTNPCGEQPLLPYESCNLGSINLGALVRTGEDGRKGPDYDRLAAVVDLAVHFLDNVIDASRYPLEEISQMTRANRKIGLGVMGFADYLVNLGIPYGTEEAVQAARDIMSFIQERAKSASRKLAETRGAFPNFAGSRPDLNGEPPVRNATVTTIAPTGTISTIAGCSSGIEPYFALAYERRVLSGETLVEVVPLLEEKLAEAGLNPRVILDAVIKTGSLKGVPQVPAALADLFETAMEISPRSHLAIQAAFQEFTENAVSKTINLPNSTTVDEVEAILLEAYTSGCKGITVYRDGSRSEQVLSSGVGQAPSKNRGPRNRPDMLTGTTQKFKIGCGNLYVTVNSDEQGICEVFTNTGREGGCASQSEATSRLVSIALRSGVPVDSVAEQIRGIRCPACIRRDGVRVTSCPDAIGRSLEAVVKIQGILPVQAENAATMAVASNPAAGITSAAASNAVLAHSPHTAAIDGRCPECGEPMVMESGCRICKSCGYSKCG